MHILTTFYGRVFVFSLHASALKYNGQDPHIITVKQTRETSGRVWNIFIIVLWRTGLVGLCVRAYSFQPTFYLGLTLGLDYLL